MSWVHFIEDTKSKFPLILSRISIPFSWLIESDGRRNFPMIPGFVSSTLSIVNFL